jgi:hypothetical protein
MATIGLNCRAVVRCLRLAPSDWRAMRQVRAQVRRGSRAVEMIPSVCDELLGSGALPNNIVIEQPGELDPPPAFHNGLVYHFTDTCHLASIICDGALRAPLDDILWATTNSAGDRLSSTGSGRGHEYLKQGISTKFELRREPRTSKLIGVGRPKSDGRYGGQSISCGEARGYSTVHAIVAMARDRFRDRSSIVRNACMG